MSEKAKLSIVIITKNEEARIRDCLESANWAEEIILVDDESSDRTREIAAQYTDKIFVRKMDIEGRHRNWAYAKAAHPWVLSLDADEIITCELREEIKQLLSRSPDEFGFTIPRRNYIGKFWVRHCGWYPSPQLRLFQKDKFRYEEVDVHPQAFMNGPCGHLKSDLIHYSYRDIADFLAKMNNQTTREAYKWISRSKKMTLGRFLWRSIDRFFRSYIGKQGYKDGFIGFVVSYFSGIYQFVSYLKYREIKIQEKGEA